MTENEDVYASIDYLTLSGTSPTIANLWGELGDLILQYHDKGEETTALREFDYKGYRIGDLAYFDNGIYGYIRADGAASGYFFDLAEGYDVTCTRIDLQATVTHPPYDIPGSSGKMRLDAGHLVEASAEVSPDVGSPKVWRENNGCTVYIGTRAHHRYLRVYRKDVESPDENWPTHSWRWEVELKRPSSTKVYGQLRDLDASDRRKAILSYVRDYCASRGVYQPFEGKTASGLDDTIARRKTSFERKLVWLENAVAPTVRNTIDKDIARADTQFTLALLRALGIASSPIIAKHVLELLRQIVHGNK